MKNVTLEDGTLAEQYSLWEFLDYVEQGVMTPAFGKAVGILIDENAHTVRGKQLNQGHFEDLALICLGGRKVEIIWQEH